MRVRALKTTHGSYGTLPRGSVAEISDGEAREMISLGYMIEDMPLDKQEAAPANDNRPLAPTGGPTGAGVPQSLSRADQAQPELTSLQDANGETLPEGQYVSSPSTTDTDSAHGQTSSTPATTTGGKRRRGRTRSKG